MRAAPCQAGQLSRLHALRPRPFALQRPALHHVRANSNTKAAVRSTPGLQTMPWTGSKEQEEALQRLEQHMQSCQAGTPDIATQRWFLRDRKLDVHEAAQKLRRMMEWRQDFLGGRTPSEADVAPEASTGKAYLHSQRDVNGRPVIIIRACRHVTGERPLDDSKRLCAHLLEKAIDQLDGDCETILGIFDLRSFGPQNADFGFVRFLVDAFFSYYPKRLGQVLFVDAPWGFNAGWSVVKPWLKKYAALVSFVSREELRRQYFTPQTIPDDFRKRYCGSSVPCLKQTAGASAEPKHPWTT